MENIKTIQKRKKSKNYKRYKLAMWILYESDSAITDIMSLIKKAYPKYKDLKSEYRRIK